MHKINDLPELMNFDKKNLRKLLLLEDDIIKNSSKLKN